MTAHAVQVAPAEDLLAAGRVALGGDFGDHVAELARRERLAELGDARRARKHVDERLVGPAQSINGPQGELGRISRDRPASERLRQHLRASLPVEKGTHQRHEVAARLRRLRQDLGCARRGPCEIELGQGGDRQQPRPLPARFRPASASIGADPAFPPMVARASNASARRASSAAFRPSEVSKRLRCRSQLPETRQADRGLSDRLPRIAMSRPCTSGTSFSRSPGRLEIAIGGSPGQGLESLDPHRRRKPVRRRSPARR